MARTLRGLPPRVHARNGAYYYVKRQGKKRPWIFLSRISDGDAALYRGLAKATSQSVANTGDLLLDFITRGMDHLRPATQRNYRGLVRNLRTVFGHMDPDSITPGDVAQYLEARKRGGSPIAGNREIEVLGSVYQYGLRNGFCKSNPCRFVRRNTESPKRRYISHDDFTEAVDRAPEAFQDFLALAYLTGLRQKDLRDLKKQQLTPEGIVVDESKTGKRRIIGYSDSLRWFLRRACNRSGGDFVLTNSRGAPWGEWAVQSAMRRLGVEWTLHQVRHKAETDHKEGMGLLPLYRRITRHGATR